MSGETLHRRTTTALAGLVMLFIAGCASVAPPAPPPPPAPAPVPAPSPSWRDAVTAFEKEQRESARAAQRAGRYVDAQRSWDVVLFLQPDDAEAAAGREQSGRSATETATGLVSRARQAQSRGDAEGAMRLYVEALSLDPTQTAAADALRNLEHDRARRVTRQTFARVPTPSPRPMPAERNALEHASLLAAEGDVDGAIALLAPLVQDARSDPAARARLADLRVRRAETLAPTNRAAAVSEAEQALRIQPGHEGATQLLQRLRATNGTPPR